MPDTVSLLGCCLWLACSYAFMRFYAYKIAKPKQLKQEPETENENVYEDRQEDEILQQRRNLNEKVERENSDEKQKEKENVDEETEAEEEQHEDVQEKEETGEESGRYTEQIDTESQEKEDMKNEVEAGNQDEGDNSEGNNSEKKDREQDHLERERLQILQNQVLLDNLEPSYGLTDRLISGGVLDCKAQDDLNRNQLSRAEMCNILLSYINNSNLEIFLTGLRETKQSHLAAFIEYSCKKSSTIHDNNDTDWPLDESERKIINRLHTLLIQEMATNEMMDALLSSDCISDMHRDHINKHGTKQEKNRELVDIIKRRSKGDVNKFWEFVIKNSSHLKRYVEQFHESGGNMALIKIKTDRTLTEEQKEKISNKTFKRGGAEFNAAESDVTHGRTRSVMTEEQKEIITNKESERDGNESAGPAESEVKQYNTYNITINNYYVCGDEIFAVIDEPKDVNIEIIVESEEFKSAVNKDLTDCIGNDDITVERLENMVHVNKDETSNNDEKDANVTNIAEDQRSEVTQMSEDLSTCSEEHDIKMGKEDSAEKMKKNEKYNSDMTDTGKETNGSEKPDVCEDEGESSTETQKNSAVDSASQDTESQNKSAVSSESSNVKDETVNSKIDVNGGDGAAERDRAAAEVNVEKGENLENSVVQVHDNSKETGSEVEKSVTEASVERESITNVDKSNADVKCKIVCSNSTSVDSTSEINASDTSTNHTEIKKEFGADIGNGVDDNDSHQPSTIEINSSDSSTNHIEIKKELCVNVDSVNSNEQHESSNENNVQSITEQVKAEISNDSEVKCGDLTNVVECSTSTNTTMENTDNGAPVKTDDTGNNAMDFSDVGISMDCSENDAVVICEEVKTDTDNVVAIVRNEECIDLDEDDETTSEENKLKRKKSPVVLPIKKALLNKPQDKHNTRQAALGNWLSKNFKIGSSSRSSSNFNSSFDSSWGSPSSRSPYSTRGASVAEMRDRSLLMSREEKRKLYLCGNDYVTLDSIEPWSQYSLSNADRLNRIKPSDGEIQKFIEAGRRPAYDRDLNEKVSLFQGSITSLEIDAIVNAANKAMLGGGGIDGAIHSAAGEALLVECRTLCGCETGKVKTTAGYRLPAKYVIHTVGPTDGSERMLRSCYRDSLKQMMEYNAKSIAFCCISTGTYGYPPSEAVHVALDEIRNFLNGLKTRNQLDKVDRIIFCLFGDSDLRLYETWTQIYFPPSANPAVTSSSSSSSPAPSP